MNLLIMLIMNSMITTQCDFFCKLPQKFMVNPLFEFDKNNMKTQRKDKIKSPTTSPNYFTRIMTHDWTTVLWIGKHFFTKHIRGHSSILPITFSQLPYTQRSLPSHNWPIPCCSKLLFLHYILYLQKTYCRFLPST